MNYTLDTPNTHFLQDEAVLQSSETWPTQQFSINNDPDFSVLTTNIPLKLTPENLLLNDKEECDLIEGQLFRDFNDVGKVEYHDSNSSDKSSPSTILNSINNNNNHNAGLNQDEIMSDDKDAGLSQKELANRRKAQNRAAQRAFRERKEMKLKELEDKLHKSENDKLELVKKLEQLKKQNIVICTENKILAQNGSIDSSLNAAKQTEDTSTFTFPTNDEFHKVYLTPNQLKNPEIPYELKRLTITEVWDYLIENYDSSLRIDQVMSEIKGLEVCHQHGPAYPLKLVDELAQKSLKGVL